jgi:hypothetical protein
MTATAAPGIDLDWVTFLDEEHPETCGFRSDPCSRQATHVGTFRRVTGNCPEFSSRILYCLVHRDLLMQQLVASGDPFFRCPHGRFCTVAELLRMEALR